MFIENVGASIAWTVLLACYWYKLSVTLVSFDVENVNGDQPCW